MKFRLFTIIFTIFFVTQVKASLITIDADNYIRGSIVNNNFSGITLSAVGTEPLLTGNVIISDKPAKNFGGNTDFVFGYTQTNNFWVGGYSLVHEAFQVDFDTPTDFITISFATGTGSSEFRGFLRAYGSTGTLLEEIITPLSGSIDGTLLAAISRTTADISYIQATGQVVSIDSFQYSIVPVPTSVWLFGSALIGLIGVRKQKN